MTYETRVTSPDHQRNNGQHRRPKLQHSNSKRWHSPRVTVLGLASGAAFTLIAVLTYALWFNPSMYDIQPDAALLTNGDVGSSYTQTGTGSVGSAQLSISPLPYQQKMLGGRIRVFTAISELAPAGQKEIVDWLQRYNIPFASRPTAMGPFVADHQGIFEIYDVVRSFQTIDAAKQEYHCCTYDRSSSFTGYRTLQVHLGDEADAWTGIKRPPSGPSISAAIPQIDLYQERGYVVHWRTGPVVSTIAIWGAHSITLSDALRLASIANSRIMAAIKNSKTGGISHASMASLLNKPLPCNTHKLFGTQ